MRMPICVSALSLSLAVALLLTGCRSGILSLPPNIDAVAVAPAIVPAASDSTASVATPLPPPASLMAPATVSPPSSGLLVCEPVAQNTDAPTADFGTGCSRWLFFTVGGMPALGRTPLWSEVESAWGRLNRPSLHLTLPDAVRLGGLVGATHVAVGIITGNADHCTLTYRLWAIPHGGAIGTPVTVTGTKSQVVNALPQMARQFALRLGAASPRIPPIVGGSPADLVLTGQVPWGPEGTPTAKQETALQALSPHWPLAGLLALNTGLRGDQKLPAVANVLLTQAPDNALAYARIAYVQPAALRGTGSAALTALRARYPACYALAHSAVWWERENHDPKAEMLAARQAVRDAPGNPDAWLSLGETLSNEANRLRVGRYSSLLSPRESAFLDVIYSQWLGAVCRAAGLDPRYGKAWLRVAEAATFSNQSTVADTAFWNALHLDPNHADVYGWGLQMYQAKWGGDLSTLARVGGLAAADHYPTVGDAITVAGDLAEAGMPDQANNLMGRALADEQAAVKRSPNDAYAHWALAAALRHQKRPSEAISEYQTAVRLMPDDADLHYETASAYDDLHQEPSAISEYRAVLRLHPNHPQAHYDLGWDLKHSGQLAQAEREMRLAVQVNPTYADAHFGLGEVFFMTHRGVPAIAQYRLAVNLANYFPAANERLIYLLDKNGRYDDAIAVGSKALVISPNDTVLLDNMADCYLNKKQWAASISYSKRSLQIDANDATAHENLGEGEAGKGDLSDARAEWHRVLQLDNGDMAKFALADLAKHP